MTVNTAASVSSRTMVQECGGSPTKAAGTEKVILITLPSSYDTLGSALDLSTPFPNRVFWALPMTAIAADGATPDTYTQIGVVPGTAKTDGLGGFASTDWKITSSVSAAEVANTGDISDHVCYIVACGC
jgi:hypothetical protein